ncbi:hypothetical protein ACOME3_004415 [Neoechinorhynchus agilis]
MEGLKSFKGIFEEKKITFDDISQRSTLLMLNPPPKPSKEEFQEIRNVFGVDPIKYLRKNLTMDPYAILVAGTQDTINEIKGRNFPFLACWIEFSSQNKTSIHNFILTQCQKCCRTEPGSAITKSNVCFAQKTMVRNNVVAIIDCVAPTAENIKVSTEYVLPL